MTKEHQIEMLKKELKESKEAREALIRAVRDLKKTQAMLLEEVKGLNKIVRS